MRRRRFYEPALCRWRRRWSHGRRNGCDRVKCIVPLKPKEGDGVMLRVGLVTLMVVLAVGSGWAQVGTLHIPSAVPCPEDTVQLTGQVRAFEDSENLTYNVNARGGVAPNVDMSLGWFSMSSEGPEPIGGAVRRSELHLLTLGGLWQVQSGNWRMALRGGGEFPVRTVKGINTELGLAAPQRQVIPFIAGVVEFGDPDRTVYLFEAKGVGWDADMAVEQLTDGIDTDQVDGDGAVVEGFGSLFIVGIGAVHNFGAGKVFADLAYPVSGENCINEETNAVEQALVWSLGGSYNFGGGNDLTLTVGLSNAAGPTAATSTLAAPGSSVGVVAGISARW